MKTTIIAGIIVLAIYLGLKVLAYGMLAELNDRWPNQQRPWWRQRRRR